MGLSPPKETRAMQICEILFTYSLRTLHLKNFTIEELRTLRTFQSENSRVSKTSPFERLQLKNYYYFKGV